MTEDIQPNAHGTREEHIAWAKARALQYVRAAPDRAAQWFASLASDLRSDPRTKDHPDIAIGFQLVLSGKFTDAQRIREFIEEIR